MKQEMLDKANQLARRISYLKKDISMLKSMDIGNIDNVLQDGIREILTEEDISMLRERLLPRLNGRLCVLEKEFEKL